MHVVIYARVSSAEQRDGRTIESQLRELKRLADLQGHMVVRTYTDNGYSGALLNRPGLDSLRDEAARGSFDAVLVNDVDRLSRDVSHLAVLRRDLERKGVKLLFAKLSNEEGPMNDFMVNILGSFAEFERALIADRTRRGKRHKTQDRGLIMGNIPPYGYDYEKKDRDRGTEGYYKVNPAEARIVRQMFSWVANEGHSIRAVMRRLNEHRIPARHSKKWAKSSTTRVLKNETYAGTTYYNKYDTTVGEPSADGCRRRQLRDRSDWVPITLPSDLHLISRETFQATQRQIQKHRVHSPRSSRHFYLLRYVRRVCARCGMSYTSTPFNGKRYYRCNKRCGAGSVRARTIEGPVWQTTVRLVENPEFLREQVEAYKNDTEDRLSMLQNENNEHQQELRRAEREAERILTAYRRGLISIAQFEQETSALRERRRAAEAALGEVLRRAPRETQLGLEGDIDAWTTRAKRNLKRMSPEQQQRFLGDLLEEIVIGKNEILVRGVIPVSRHVGTTIEERAQNFRGQTGKVDSHRFQLRLDLEAKTKYPESGQASTPPRWRSARGATREPKRRSPRRLWPPQY